MKKLIALLMVFVSCSACAQNEVALEVTPSVLALQAFSQSILAIEKRDSECKQQQAALPYADIKALNLTSIVLKTALSYHYANATYQCVKPALSEFLLASAALEDIAPDELELKKGLNAGNNLVVTQLTQTIKAQVEYLKLSEVDRAAVESISALYQPFNLIEAATALDLFAKP